VPKKLQRGKRFRILAITTIAVLCKWALAKFSSLPVHFFGGVTGTSTNRSRCAKGASERIGAVEIVGATIDRHICGLTNSGLMNGVHGIGGKTIFTILPQFLRLHSHNSTHGPPQKTDLVVTQQESHYWVLSAETGVKVYLKTIRQLK